MRRAGVWGAWYGAAAMSLGLAVLAGCIGSAEPRVPAIEGYLPRGKATVKPAGEAGAATEKAKAATLEECVKIALAESPMNEAAREGVVSAREAMGEAEAPYYPQAKFDAGYRRWKTHAFLPSGLLGLTPPGTTIPTEVGPVNDYTINVNGGYVVFDSGERRARLMAAKAGVGAATEEATSIRQDIVLNVHEAYYSHLAALSAEEVAQKNLKLAEDHLRLAEKRKEVGVAVEADVMRSRVSVADARLALVGTEDLVRVTRGNLNTAMGLPVELPVEVSREAGAIESPANVDLNKALVEAVHSRSELKAALQRIAGARSEVDAAKSAFGPKVTAQGQYGKRDDKFFPEDDDWSIGAAVEWPIFTGFSRVHALNRAKSELAREEALVRQRVLEVRQEVWRSHSELTKSYEAVEASEVLVKEATESMKLTQDRYKAGTNTITDLLDAQTALARAEGSRVRTQWEYYISRARFQRAMGEMDRSM